MNEFTVQEDRFYGFVVVYRNEDSFWRPCFQTRDRSEAVEVADALNGNSILDAEVIE